MAINGLDTIKLFIIHGEKHILRFDFPRKSRTDNRGEFLRVLLLLKDSSLGDFFRNICEQNRKLRVITTNEKRTDKQKLYPDKS